MMKKSEMLAVLKASDRISDYELTITDKDSRELFYVLDHLEINRAVKVRSASIRVYVSDGKTTGSSLVSVTAADDAASLSSKVTKAAARARQARNAYYPLAEKSRNVKKTKTAKEDLNDIASRVAKATSLPTDTAADGSIRRRSSYPGYAGNSSARETSVMFPMTSGSR